MYLSWGLVGHHKFRRPGEDKAVEWTALAFTSHTLMQEWLAYFNKANGKTRLPGATVRTRGRTHSLLPLCVAVCGRVCVCVCAFACMCVCVEGG